MLYRVPINSRFFLNIPLLTLLVFSIERLAWSSLPLLSFVCFLFRCPHATLYIINDLFDVFQPSCISFAFNLHLTHQLMPVFLCRNACQEARPFWSLYFSTITFHYSILFKTCSCIIVSVHCTLSIFPHSNSHKSFDTYPRQTELYSAWNLLRTFARLKRYDS